MGVKWWKKNPDAIIVMSGGGLSKIRTASRQTDLMMELAQNLGVPKDKLVADTLSRNTWEHPQNILELSSINKNTRNVKCKITPFVKSTNLSKKEYLESIGFNKPKSKEDAEFCFLFSDNFSDQFRRDSMELHDKLFEIIGAYDRFVYYVYTLDGDNEEAISILNEIGVWGGDITSIDEVFESRSCLSAFWRFFPPGSELNEYSFCNWPNPFEHTPWIANQKNKNIALTQFNYINPLPKNTIDIFRQAKKIVVCELNRGQFVDYLRAQFPDIKFNQYNKTQGLPFTTIELTQYFDNLLNK